VVLILLEIGEGDFEYPALESVVCILETGGAVHEGLTDISNLESSWGLDVVPVFLRECVGLLLEALLAL